jgi:cellulose biosynthesis protein BcsQ
MKVITCFSYKGGAGRTIAAANIAAALASERGGTGAIREPLNCKVALIDLDVFSAGTHRVFDISNQKVQALSPCVQDFLLQGIPVSRYADTGGLQTGHDLMSSFRAWGAADYCRKDFTLFPAKADPGLRFLVQKYHDNQLLGLMMELENRGYDFVVIDGESGMRPMADIATRLAHVVLMFFRLTGQHVDGTLEALEDLRKRPYPPACYLIPTCVPLAGRDDTEYQLGAFGLEQLRALTDTLPKESGLNDIAEENKEGIGRFWALSRGRTCIHDSLLLKSSERVLVYDPRYLSDHAAADYYQIAAELKRLHHAS